MLHDDELLRTDRFRVVHRSREEADGGTLSRHAILHPGAVTILPWVDEARICLVQNYRLAVDQTLIELPAGTRDPQETPAETAHRELAEETGFTCGRLEPLAEFWMSPGILSERMHVYQAFDLRAGDPHREEDERIENLIVEFAEAVQMAVDGRIQDAKTVAALLLAERGC